MKKTIRLFLAISWAFFLASTLACASRQHVAQEYADIFHEGGPQRTSGRTVIFFLVDGLSISAVSGGFAAGRLPNLSSFFIGSSGKFHKARTVFPSLTFPAISSLLTEQPVDQSGVLGNRVYDGERLVDFESPSRYPELNERIRGRNVFSRMKARGLTSVSLDYGFHGDANAVASDSDLKAGLAVVEKDYAYIDEKLIDSLDILLDEERPERWPDFIFIHLVGVDFTSHDFGPDSMRVADYLAGLDARLGPVLTRFQNAERSGRRQVVALLSADHGFDEPVSQVMHLEKSVDRLDSRIRFVDEGRFGTLQFPQDWIPARRSEVLAGLAIHPLTDIVAWRDGENLVLQSHERLTTIRYSAPGLCPDGAAAISVSGGAWNCPDSLASALNDLYYPYFIANISRYFAGAGHPDAVVIPKPGVAFNDHYRGQHGGPTPRELFVPLLIHNGKLASGEIPPLWKLLRFL